MDRCVEQVVAKQPGLEKQNAIAICYRSVVEGKSLDEALKWWADIVVASKAGARHNVTDRAIITRWHERADELKVDMAELGAEIAETPVAAPLKAGALDLGDSITEYAAEVSIKALADLRLEIKVAYGGPFAGRDAQGEYFSARTDLDEEHYPTPPVTYYHGFNENGQPQGKPIFIGKTLKRENRADGHYLTAQLRAGNAYAERTYAAALKGEAVASPATAVHLRRKEADGHLAYWPIIEIAAWDYAPDRKPANPWSVARPALKAIYDEAGLTLPQAAFPGAPGRANAAADENGDDFHHGEFDMDEHKVQELVAAALKADREAQAAVEQKRQADAEQLKAAVAAERQLWEAQAAKARRLPLGGEAPAQAHFSDTRKYDGLKAGDQAFLCAMLGAAGRKGGGSGIPAAALKALGIKVAEDKTDVGEQGRNALKALDIVPADFLDAVKANELNYTTQAGFGDEFVPTVWSTELWLQVRALSFVLDKLPAKEFTGPGDTFTIPLEGADPTWYRIGQTTDLNATTGLPDATIGDSKIATGNLNLPLGKVGARVAYSGEMNEDSIIPWVEQVRAQTERSFAEQMEHLIIDGDTATGATVNINHIGGTPTSTGTKQDLYLTFNGLRKSPLVTTVANSYDAAATLVDTVYLEILKLMGTAGLVGADAAKVDFIQDPNVTWKVQTLVSVKTRDVFTNATLENGMFKGIWGYKVYTSYFMHYKSAVRKANIAGKVDITTPANNTRGAILGVRWDQWLAGWKRHMGMKLQDIPGSDAQQIIATARLGLVQRDTEGSAIAFNVLV